MIAKKLLLLGLLAQQGAWANPVLPSAESVRANNPELAANIDSMTPIRNRAGMWFFPGSHLADPSTQALLLERFHKRTDSDEIRRALVHRIDQELHHFSWGEIQSESHPELRASMLHWTKREHGPRAAELLRHALEDPSPIVRREAARLVGYKPLSATLTEGLIHALEDLSSETRAMAVRSLGWQKTPDVVHLVLPLLGDADPDVVYRSLTALDNLGATSPSIVPLLEPLQNSLDERISQQARRMLQALP